MTGRETVVPGLADRVRLLMQANYAGSVTNFARALGAETTQVSSWVSGVTGINAARLRCIAEVTHVSLDWLLLGGVDGPIYRDQDRSPQALEQDVGSFLAREIANTIFERGPATVPNGVDVDGRGALREMINSGVESIRDQISEKKRNDEIAEILNGLRQDFAALGTLIVGKTEPSRQDQLASALSDRIWELRRLQALARESSTPGPVRLGEHETRKTNPTRSRLSLLLAELDAAGGQPTYDRVQYFGVLRKVGEHLHAPAPSESPTPTQEEPPGSRKSRRKRA